MKVVLFCGGLGLRLREVSDHLPKPMVNIGYRPILWHIMKYYAHYGHKEFILCLGFGADIIKNYFLNYNECLSNDFVLSGGGKHVELFNSDIDDWSITFVDSGIHANIGQRLKAAERYLGTDEVFLANYSDGLTDLRLPDQLTHFQQQQKIASFLCVPPNLSCHFVSFSPNGVVETVRDVHQADLHINGGYFIFHRDIFSYMRHGEELLHEPFQRLVEARQVVAYKYDGFWGCMDTFKEKQQLDELYARGHAPWEVWKQAKPPTAASQQTNGMSLHPNDKLKDRGRDRHHA